MMDTSERGGILTAPKLAPEIRQQMSNALYSGFYANALPREEFDKQFGGKSDFDIAGAAYDTFYKGKLSRQDFNKQIGFETAPGSTNAAMMQGITLGASDEIASAVAGLGGAIRGKGFMQAYRDAMEAQRQNAEVFRQNNPYIGRGVEVVSGVGSGLAASGVRAAGQVPGMMQTMARGAGLGGFSGAASADGGPQERAIGGAVGAGIGAAAPPLIGAIAQPVASGWRAAKNLMGFGDPAAQAERKIVQTLARSGMTTHNARTAMDDFPADKPGALLDVMGRPGVNLGAATANRPGSAMETADRFVEMRRAGATDRIEADVTRHIAPGGGGNYAATVQGLIDTRSRNAAPLYEEAFSKPAGMTDRLREFIDDPIARSGLARGLELQRLENLARSPGARVPIKDAAIEFAEDGTPKIVSVPNMRTLDAVKRGLDDILEGYRDKTTGRLVLDQRGRAIDAVRRAYVEQLDEGNPAYRAARQAWAGPSQAWDEMELGRKIVTADRDSVAKILSNIPPEKREFYRMGVARVLTDRTSDPTSAGSFVRRMVEDKNFATKLGGLFDRPEDYQKFVKLMQSELTMRETNRAVSPRAGSQTARVLAEHGEAAPGSGSVMQDVLHTGARGGRPTVAVLSRMYERGQAGSPQMAGELGQRLFATNRQAIATALDSIDRRATNDAMNQYMRQQLLRAVLSGGTAGLSQQVAP